MQCDGKPCGSEAAFLRAPGEPFYMFLVDSASAAKVLHVSGCSCYLLTDRRHPWLKIPKYSAQT